MQVIVARHVLKQKFQETMVDIEDVADDEAWA